MFDLVGLESARACGVLYAPIVRQTCIKGSKDLTEMGGLFTSSLWHAFDTHVERGNPDKSQLSEAPPATRMSCWFLGGNMGIHYAGAMEGLYSPSPR